MPRHGEIPLQLALGVQALDGLLPSQNVVRVEVFVPVIGVGAGAGAGSGAAP